MYKVNKIIGKVIVWARFFLKQKEKGIKLCFYFYFPLSLFLHNQRLDGQKDFSNGSERIRR